VILSFVENTTFPCENNYATPVIAKEWLDEVEEAFKNAKN